MSESDGAGVRGEIVLGEGHRETGEDHHEREEDSGHKRHSKHLEKFPQKCGHFRDDHKIF